MSSSNKRRVSPFSGVSWARRLRRILYPLIALALALAAAGDTTAAQTRGEGRVQPHLRQKAAAQPHQTFRVIVTRSAQVREAQSPHQGTEGALAAAGAKKLKDAAPNAVVAELPGHALDALARDPSVQFVSLDAPMIKTGVVDPGKLANVYAQTVNAPQAWSTGAKLTGAGVGVAVLDTGIATYLPDWRDAQGRSRIVAQTSFTALPTTTLDLNGHGTHVAGIIAGNSWHAWLPASRGKYVGIAPEANLINVKVTDDAGMAYMSDVVSGIEWVIENRQKYNIRVLNLSLMSSVPESYQTSFLAAAVERAWFNGIFVVVSAGNTGANSVVYPPANDPFVMTVGAADPQGTAARGDDGMAPWSGYGTTQDGITKPDVVAPGRRMIAPLALGGSRFATQFPDRVVDTHYIWASGTSMSAPVVSGAAALLFQAHPEWTNDQVKWVLQKTAIPVGTTAAGTFNALPGQGAGQIDAAAAAAFTSKPGYANQGLTHSKLLVTADGSTTYNSAAWNTGSWATGSWATGSWATGSWATGSWATGSWTTALEQIVE